MGGAPRGSHGVGESQGDSTGSRTTSTHTLSHKVQTEQLSGRRAGVGLSRNRHGSPVHCDPLPCKRLPALP